MSLSTFYLAAFVGFAALELTGEALGVPALIVYTKPYLAVWLAAWFLETTKINRPHPAAGWVVGGLGFSALGDGILLYHELEQQRELFVLGALAFYVAHGAYLTALAKFRPPARTPTRRAVLVFLLWLTGAVVIFGDFVRGYGGTEFIYATVLLAVGVRLVRRKTALGGAFETLLCGIGLFVVSDALVALANGLDLPTTPPGEATRRGLRVAIMLTYVGAQFLLARGFAHGILAHSKRPTATRTAPEVSTTDSV